MMIDDGDILLVEDTDEDAELTLRALKKRGLANPVVRVSDGAAALDYLEARGAYAGRDRAHLPQVILLDLHLPKLSGIEVLRRIKADERFRLIPVVVLTSSQEDVDLAECYRLGVNSYVTKPVGFDEFSRVVGELGFYWLLINRQAYR